MRVPEHKHYKKPVEENKETTVEEQNKITETAAESETSKKVPSTYFPPEPEHISNQPARNQHIIVNKQIQQPRR